MTLNSCGDGFACDASVCLLGARDGFDSPPPPQALSIMDSVKEIQCLEWGRVLIFSILFMIHI
ncbi:hypothetical protein C2134_19715 [Chromobacterium sinusclupearum]|uniref:Uncharacterized protein n=1 Tax=Chromobacterium sinusclupearum TaxID=2077146 RepID=A0A2K4MIK3_9NEIS|nr:hypothetical protein C2134_19715 [Chromobacterium sinusclupearum]